MPLPEIADVMRVAVSGTTQGGKPWANILHFRKTTALTYAGAIAVLDPKLLAHYTVGATGRVPWATIAPSGAALSQFAYTPLDGASATTLVSHASASPSTATGEAPNVAMVASLHTTLRGKRNRGRVYMGPVQAPTIGTNGQFTSGWVNDAAAQWAYFLAQLSGSGVSLVVASYGHGFLHGVPITWSPYATDVVSVTINNRPDTQRRRLGR